MNLFRTAARYSTARAFRASGASYSMARALSLLIWPWGRRG